LEVIAPDGTLYRGNQFNAGQSVPNATNTDQLNNVEGVFLSQPATGDYLIRVRGHSVVQDARVDTSEVDQDFALVTSGDLLRPGTGVILLDHSVYTAPEAMQIRVFDANRAASNCVHVLVTNLTSGAWLVSPLQRDGNYGYFTGAVTTVVCPAGAGEIQVADGDRLAAEYVDSGGTNRVATATTDLTEPVITSVAATVDLGILTLTWLTSEPATSVVCYGTNSSNLNLVATNLALVTNHVIKLNGLVMGATYYYRIIGSDLAGNVATNDNSGAFYTFVGIGKPIVLLVDAYDTVAEQTNGATVIPDSACTNVLNAAGIPYGFWKVNARGYPQLADLQSFPVVMWRLTDDEVYYGQGVGSSNPAATNNTLNAPQQAMIETYLNGGGSFFLASMGILSQLGDVPFRHDVLHVDGFRPNPELPAPCMECDEDRGVPMILGMPATIASGVDVTLDYSNYPAYHAPLGEVYGPDFSDTFTPSTNAMAVAYESMSGNPCGISYPKIGGDSPGRVVFLAFPFDTIPTNTAASNNAVVFLQNIVTFLAPGANGRGVIRFDNSTYTTNELVTVEVGDSDLAGTGQLPVSFTVSSGTNQATVSLHETPRPGLFSGTLALTGGEAAINQLRVQNGDVITATYFDASANSNVTATAVIDLAPPVISQVAASATYFNARVTWLTSKQADATVFYGTQPPLTNSVYIALLATNHAVLLSGLQANQAYYYEVASRDQAGNVSVKDNGGSFYPLATLAAAPIPVLDNLESGATNWSVLSNPMSSSNLIWRLGLPNNDLCSSAHSGSNCWSSDLDGNQNFNGARTYLFTPAIDLSGLRSATLTFWQACDFSRTYLGQYFEDGLVFVATNSSLSATNLALAADLAGIETGGWAPATVELTPFVGKTIQLVFYYKADPVGDTIYGWTIDDLAVTGVIAGGDIVITKNLGQGAWYLSALSTNGLMSYASDVTPSATISNAPPGQYVIQFGNVPYYLTPPPQTNTVVAYGETDFAGSYTFSDINSNGMSDAWELAYFGEISTNRTMTTDTDGNGMSDYAKFVAGINPTNSAALFGFTGAIESNSIVQIQWNVATNRLYQVNASADLANWLPVTGWLQASNLPVMFYSATNTGDGPQFFRVQVQP
jgi:hypothetical protein